MKAGYLNYISKVRVEDIDKLWPPKDGDKSEDESEEEWWGLVQPCHKCWRDATEWNAFMDSRGGVGQYWFDWEASETESEEDEPTLPPGAAAARVKKHKKYKRPSKDEDEGEEVGKGKTLRRSSRRAACSAFLAHPRFTMHH